MPTEVSTDKRFRGSVRLVKLHLWRLAHSTDLEEGFQVARDMGFFSKDNEAFVRDCLAIDEVLEQGAQPDSPVTPQMVHELQMCAIRLNSADPA